MQPQRTRMHVDISTVRRTNTQCSAYVPDPFRATLSATDSCAHAVCVAIHALCADALAPSLAQCVYSGVLKPLSGVHAAGLNFLPMHTYMLHMHGIGLHNYAAHYMAPIMHAVNVHC